MFYTANHIESIPVNFDIFFGCPPARKCLEWSIYRGKDGELVLILDDYGENASTFSIEEVADTKYGTVYHANHYYYFLLVEDVDEFDQDYSYVLVRGVY